MTGINPGVISAREYKAEKHGLRGFAAIHLSSATALPRSNKPDIDLQVPKQVQKEFQGTGIPKVLKASNSK